MCGAPADRSYREPSCDRVSVAETGGLRHQMKLSANVYVAGRRLETRRRTSPGISSATLEPKGAERSIVGSPHHLPRPDTGQELLSNRGFEQRCSAISDHGRRRIRVAGCCVLSSSTVRPNIVVGPSSKRAPASAPAASTGVAANRTCPVLGAPTKRKGSPHVLHAGVMTPVVVEPPFGELHVAEWRHSAAEPFDSARCSQSLLETRAFL